MHNLESSADKSCIIVFLRLRKNCEISQRQICSWGLNVRCRATETRLGSLRNCFHFPSLVSDLTLPPPLLPLAQTETLYISIFCHKRQILAFSQFQQKLVLIIITRTMIKVGPSWLLVHIRQSGRQPALQGAGSGRILHSQFPVQHNTFLTHTSYFNTIQQSYGAYCSPLRC